MGNVAVNGYVDIVGKHGQWIGDHTGPASYVAWAAPTTGGDVVTAKQFGLRSIDMISPAGIDTSGTYNVRPQCTGTGLRQTWTLIWYTTATGSQVAAGTNLSAIKIRLNVHGG
jgi:hypothetical protein